jgi:hypothetical protein
MVLDQTDVSPVTQVDEFGNQTWLMNGRLHRTDGPAVIGADGYQEWYHHGQRHRTDGPALIYPNGTQEWYHHGQRHRTDGPAVIRADDGYQEWYVNHKNITLEVNNWMSNKGVSWPWDITTQLEFSLTWV